MTNVSTVAIAALFAKKARGASMAAAEVLRLCPEHGVVDDESPSGYSPRQVCIATVENLGALGLTLIGSRANIVLSGGAAADIRSGTLIVGAEIAVRITMECEPCAHGAELAGARLPEFRPVRRFLGAVVRPGRVLEKEHLTVEADVFSRAPFGFRARCAWAVDQIPTGAVVTTLELLTAIGASRSYGRVLPRWLYDAGVEGSPIHRVLSTKLAPGSWTARECHALRAEGVDLTQRQEPFALSRTIWFDGGRWAIPIPS